MVRNDGTKHKHKNVNKPWWSDELQLLWKKVKETEKLWHNSNSNSKSRLRANMSQARKKFDKEVQRCKRKIWYSEQRKLEEMYSFDKSQFWKTIGQIGVVNDRNKTIPFMYWILQEKTVTAKNEVLRVWGNYFEGLFIRLQNTRLR